jgi:hypothetical protein
MPRYASLNSPLMPKTLCDLRTFVTAGLGRSIPLATLLNPRVSWPCHTFGLAAMCPPANANQADSPPDTEAGT